MQKFLTAVILLLSITLHAQIKGKITSADGQSVPYVSVTIENTYTGTTANEDGQYELGIKAQGRYTVVFKSLGFKTGKAVADIKSFPYELNITLQDESYELGEVIVTNTENPANAIIRQAIAGKKANSARTGRYEADFYSKGIFRVKNLPKKILGQKIEMPNGMVDSTGSGIIYLSETVSHITFEQPNKFKERIIASKISGNDNGFSYNTALNTNYNFYDNYVAFGINMISPLANNAFNYYRFKLEGSFFDENNNQINKIQVIPRRDKEPVFEGYIYIVEDTWAIYAVDFDIKGYRMQEPILETLNLKQNFTYNTNNKIWAKNSQIFDFTAGAFGIGFTGRFTHVYNNYVFPDSFDKKTFGKEIVFVEEQSNKKDSVYWNAARPVPLTDEEIADYTKKDSIQTREKSQVYLDSVDAKNNRFKILNILDGYTYSNSFKKYRFSYDGIIKIPYYNTVQGWHFRTGFSFTKYNEDTGRYFALGTNLNYGFAEDRLRATGYITYRNSNKSGTFYLWGGSTAEQFNPAAIDPLINTVSTLFFKDNYMKLYDKKFVALQYSKELFTGLNTTTNLQYLDRHGLLNNTDYVLIKNDGSYISNNPLQPDDYTSLPFESHTLMKFDITGTVRFGQKYINRPDGKINVSNNNYPVLSFMYQKGFAASSDNFNYDFIAARATYNKTLGNKGDLEINLKAGKFFNADGIAFTDYKHFNGNQTHVADGGSYLNVFNLMPYYTHSTNNSYLELHAEHNFKGFIENKIPLLNLLQWNLVVGYHALSTPDYRPYQEFTAGFDNVGFGKFRFLRVDYIRAYQGGFATDGVVFGLKFLDFLN